MNTLDKAVASAQFSGGRILIRLSSGVEISFPVGQNPRLSKGTPEQLGRIEVSPLGLHWPDLDEDLSFKGLLEGNFGQKTRHCRYAKREAGLDRLPAVCENEND
jgi:hypothetical protein